MSVAFAQIRGTFSKGDTRVLHGKPVMIRSLCIIGCATLILHGPQMMMSLHLHGEVKCEEDQVVEACIRED